jgi:hypothetical protein
LQNGENEQTSPELEQVSNATERARTSYNRLYGLVLQVAESQPFASSRLINLLDQSIEQAQATADAVEATALESKQVWNLL